jgi:tetratricopeptide (TPR) repeat protein
MKTILTISFVLGTIFWVNAQDFQQQADSAAHFFNQKEYQKAIDLYTDILSKGQVSAELHYNLGNAYFKAGNLPLSIVQYEKAAKLAPADEDIKFNLQLAKTQTVDKVDVVPIFWLARLEQKIINLLSTNQWAAIGLVSFLLSLTFLMWYFFSNQILIKKLSFWTAGMLLLLSMSSVWASYRAQHENYSRQYAIIVNPSINIKSSPDVNSTNLFVLHAGTKLEVLDQINEWLKVRIENGNTGWIKEKDLIKV